MIPSNVSYTASSPSGSRSRPSQGLISKEFGGTDTSTLDFALAAEEFCVVDTSLPGTILGTGLGTKPVIWFGTDEQKKRFLPDFIEDGHRLAALAFTDTVAARTMIFQIHRAAFRPLLASKARNGSLTDTSITRPTELDGRVRAATSSPSSVGPIQARVRRTPWPLSWCLATRRGLTLKPCLNRQGIALRLRHALNSRMCECLHPISSAGQGMASAWCSKICLDRRVDRCRLCRRHAGRVRVCARLGETGN